MTIRVVVVAALVAAAVARPSGPAWKGIKVASGDKLLLTDMAPHANYSGANMFKTKYHVMARTGDVFGSGTFGAHVDKNGAPTGGVSHNPDFTSILTAYNSKLYSITHFEASQPATAYFSELEQDKDGMLSIKTTAALDFSKYGGLWIPCAGSVSPWGSHLGGEEYEPDGRKFETDDVIPSDSEIVGHMAYFGETASTYGDAKAKGFNPYNYGFAWECKVDTNGKPLCEKHHTMGRMSWELPYGITDLAA